MTYDNYKVEKRQRIKRRAERDRQAQYFMKQKAFGFLLLFLSLVISFIGNRFDVPDMIIVSFVVAIVSLYPILTKHMIFVDSYWLEKFSNNKLI